MNVATGGCVPLCHYTTEANISLKLISILSNLFGILLEIPRKCIQKMYFINTFPIFFAISCWKSASEVLCDACSPKKPDNDNKARFICW